MQALSVTTTENWSACLGYYRRRGDAPYKKRYAYVPNGGTLGACLETISYGYDAAYQDWADQLTSYNGEAIRYDDSGNPISYRGYTMAWQGKRLTSATKTGTTITYSYDENGIRTQKTVNGVTTNYYYNGSVLISQVSGNDTLLFSYDASGSVVSVNFNGTDYYYIRNGQGDVVKLIDGSGTTVTEYTYDTWGKLISCTGSLSATLGTLNPFRYRGYVYDTETGWYYLQSRYYDPAVCRFISADVLLSTGQGVLGHNTFAYCLNNPVNMCDPSGCASKREMVDALLNSMIDPEIYHEVLSILSDINLKDSILCETILQGVTSSNTETATTVCYALTFLDDNIEYKLGPKDCSWFTCTAYSYTISGYPKGSMKQLEFAMDEDNNIKHGHPENWNLEFGDLLFFSSPCFCTTKCKRMFEIHHVGIYIGDGYFIDNSSNANISIRCLTPDLYTVDSNQVYVVYCARPVGGK